jgi:DNA replication protein DnaC
MTLTKLEERNCSDHGPWLAEAWQFAGREVWTPCPECAAKRQKAAEEESRKKFEAAREKAWQRRVMRAGIAKRFQGATFDKWRVTNPGQGRALAFGRNYCAQFREIRDYGRCVTFVGQPGTGKTHLATAIALELLRHNFTAYYATVADIVSTVRSTWSPRPEANGVTEEHIYAALAQPDLLIVDEVGLQSGTPSEEQIMTRVFDKRYQACLPAILISNLPAGDLRRFLGDRLTDRLNHNGLGVVPFDWQSFRSGEGK